MKQVVMSEVHVETRPGKWQNINRPGASFSKKILSPLVILSMEKTVVAMVISELKSFLDLRFFEKLDPVPQTAANLLRIVFQHVQ